MPSALIPTRASRSAAATDARATAPAHQGRPVATVVTAVLQDSVVALPSEAAKCRIQAGSGSVGRPPQ